VGDDRAWNASRGRGAAPIEREHREMTDEDEDTGVKPASKDAEGASDDELAARRRGGSTAARGEQAAIEGASGETEGEEDDGQGIFVWEKGQKVTLTTLIKRGTPIEHAFVFGGKRSKGQGGLMGFDAKPLMVVRGKPGPVKVVPTYDKDENLSKVVIENHVEAVVVANVETDEAIGLIAHVLDAKGWKAPAAAA
jgi:hypothetical protein